MNNIVSAILEAEMCKMHCKWEEYKNTILEYKYRVGVKMKTVI